MRIHEFLVTENQFGVIVCFSCILSVSSCTMFVICCSFQIVGFIGKNKREAGEAIEKIVSAKKHKKNDGVAQAVTKVKVETKTQKKKKEESSDSDDSSSEEEEVHNGSTR